MNTIKSRNYSFPRNNEGKSSLPHFNELFTFLRFYFYPIILFFFFPPPPKKVALENIKNPLNKSHQKEKERGKNNKKQRSNSKTHFPLSIEIPVGDKRIKIRKLRKQANKQGSTNLVFSFYQTRRGVQSEPKYRERERERGRESE